MHGLRFFITGVVFFWATFASAVDPEQIAAARAQMQHSVSTMSGDNAPLTLGEGNSIFERIGFVPHPGQNIVLVSNCPFLGDSLLYTLGRIAALHQLFPDSKIRLINPFADRLFSRSWLTPVAMSMFGKQYDAKLLAEITPDDFVIVDYGSIPETAATKAERAISFYTDVKPTSVNISFTVWEGRTRRHETHSLSASGIPLVAQGNKFEECDVKARFIYGDNNGLRWPPELFLDPAKEASARSFLHSEFGGAEGTLPQYAVLNLNTSGEYKLRELAKDYVSRLRIWIHAVTARPGMHTLVTPPDPRLGPEVKAAMDQIIASSEGKAAYFPADFNQWLVKFAQYVVTQDSGFNWMALTVQPPQKVLTTFSHDFMAVWHHPDQPYHSTPHRPWPESVRIETQPSLGETVSQVTARLSLRLTHDQVVSQVKHTVKFDQSILDWIVQQNLAIDCNNGLHRHVDHHLPP